MQIVYIDNVKPKALPENTALCVGNFDGVHKGHQELIKAAKRVCKYTAVMTFNPHPETVIKNLENTKLLTPLAEKIEVFEEYGVDFVLVVKFTPQFMNMHKDEFINLLKKLKFKKLICGYDFRFGYMGLGTKDDLAKAFDTDVIDKYELRGVRASSSKIRELLSEGDIVFANGMLGREYHIYGKVIHGNEMGRKIGFPTANIAYDDFYLPQTGVYLCRVVLDKEELYGMANIGHNPTINLQNEIRLEVNIFKFDRDIYGKRLDLYLIERVRPEKKFINVMELQKELERNREYGIRKFSL